MYGHHHAGERRRSGVELAGTTRHNKGWFRYHKKEQREANLGRLVAAARREEVAIGEEESGGDVRSKTARWFQRHTGGEGVRMA